jgi:hypothetical protein
VNEFIKEELTTDITGSLTNDFDFEEAINLDINRQKMSELKVSSSLRLN